ncbi:MAG: hypothetical protein GX886_17500 [Comamonadaceae bacterium]|nr:hypothetical protein [Comamonadaceae bacterium]
MEFLRRVMVFLAPGHLGAAVFFLAMEQPNRAMACLAGWSLFTLLSIFSRPRTAPEILLVIANDILFGLAFVYAIVAGPP